MSQFGNIAALTKEERAVVDWQYDLYGSFYKALFTAIKTADEGNLALLELGFPVEVGGFRRYVYEDGWWPMVEKKMADASTDLTIPFRKEG